MRAYVVFQEILHDQKTFDTYRKDVMPTLAPYEGRFLVRGGGFTVLEGSWPYERTVVIEFPSRDKAEAWYHSLAYQKILPLRLKSMTCNAIIVDGVD